MSHSMGEVIVGDKVVGYFEYNGTADFAMNRIHPTREAVDAHWRSSQNCDAECKCGQPATDAQLYTSYGGGFYWPGKVCLTCNAIVDNVTPYGPIVRKQGMLDDYEYFPTDGHPLREEEKT